MQLTALRAAADAERSVFARNLTGQVVQCTLMHFEIIGDITDIEPIAVGSAIREVARLRKQYGRGRWRKLKGIALIRLANGRIRRAELHWYEAHGIGKREIKRKRYMD
jgi:hypothetical protein